MTQTQRLMITVDVEAQPIRAEVDHVERLIWGRYPETRGGIGAMMDIADSHNAKIVMFVDYCEQGLYGDAILDVAREIHRRGHDLQLHSHPEFLPDTFWSASGLKRPGAMNAASDDQARAVFDFLCESQVRACSVAPLGYRGGGYRYGPAVLRAMMANGVRFNSSYIASRENQPLKLGRIKQFYWDNGCLEVPVSCVNPCLNLKRDFEINFNASALTSAERMTECLDAFYEQQGDDALAVLVMHSWSFSRLQQDGFFSPPLPESLERFDAFLGALKGKVQVITVPEALALAESRAISLAPTVPIARLESRLS